MFTICTTREQLSCVQLFPKNARVATFIPSDQQGIFCDGIYIDFISNTSMFDRVPTVD